MPATRGVKRTASKTSATPASTAPKNKKKRGAIQLEIPTAPKKRGRVFTCGQGDVGQLGLGEDVMETTKFRHVTALGDKIVAVSAGGMHTIALDSSGKVWTYGCNDEGALGRPTSGDKDEGTPKKVTLPAKAVAISSGDSHSAALLENGDVYAWGSFRDSHGSMGLVVQGREGKPCRDPVLVDVGEPSVAIASGGDHLVILTTSGSVFTMGCGEQGQLGRLSQRSASRDARQGFSALLVPSKVTLKAGASRVWAGYHATFVLDGSQQKVFAFGLNNYGQLGITGEKRKTALFMPVECDAFSGGRAWSAVCAGQHHSLALDGAGLVHAVGRCEYGRLGLGEGAGDAATLEPLPRLLDKKCVSIAAGTSNSFAVTDTGEVWAWGMGSEGQLGTGGCADAAEPAPAVCVALHRLRPASVAAGGQHSVLLAEDPDAKRDPTPEPEEETADEKVESEAEEEVAEEEKKPPRKRGKKVTQEEEVTSTSSAQANEVAEETIPQKFNGDENKDSAMDVDEADKTQIDEKDIEDKAPEEKMETDQTEAKPDNAETAASDDTKSQDSEDSTKTQASEKSDEKSQESEKIDIKSPESEKSDEKSQDSVKSDANSQDSDKTDVKSLDSKDVEMSEKSDVNGTEENAAVESKSVDVIQNNPLTTSA